MNPDELPLGSANYPAAGVDLGDPSLNLEELLQSPAPTCWKALRDPEERVERWEDLRSWVHWLVERFALDYKTIPPCWWRHGAVVEELTALHDAWKLSYSEMNSAAGPADWMAIFDRTLDRLRRWIGRTNCDLNHRPDRFTIWRGDAAEWAEHLAEDSAVTELDD